MAERQFIWNPQTGRREWLGQEAETQAQLAERARNGATILGGMPLAPNPEDLRNRNAAARGGATFRTVGPDGQPVAPQTFVPDTSGAYGRGHGFPPIQPQARIGYNRRLGGSIGQAQTADDVITQQGGSLSPSYDMGGLSGLYQSRNTLGQVDQLQAQKDIEQGGDAMGSAYNRLIRDAATRGDMGKLKELSEGWAKIQAARNFVNPMTVAKPASRLTPMAAQWLNDFGKTYAT